jgi:DNA-binding transcriptional regulator LsrR (DeoR family)
LPEKLHARAYHLYVPALVATQEVHDILLADPGLREALEVARQASLSMVQGRGGRYFRVVILTFRAIAFPGTSMSESWVCPWEDLRQLQNVVGVAGGPEKTEAILGALRTGLLDYLITDDETAMRLLRRIEDPPAGVEPSR